MVFLILAIMASSTVSAVGLNLQAVTVFNGPTLQSAGKRARSPACAAVELDAQQQRKIAHNIQHLAKIMRSHQPLLKRSRSSQVDDEDDNAYTQRKAQHLDHMDQFRAEVENAYNEAARDHEFQDCLPEEYFDEQLAELDLESVNDLPTLQDRALAYLRQTYGVGLLRVLARGVQRFGAERLKAWFTLFLQLAFGALSRQAAACMDGASVFGVVTLSDAQWNGTDPGNFIPGATFAGDASSQTVLSSAANGAWQGALGSALQRLTMSGVDIRSQVEDASRESILASSVPTVSAPADMMIERLAESVASAIAGPIVGAADRLANI
jgi:hypothetical protein